MEFNEKLHRRIRWPAVLHILLPLLAAFTALMVVGRLISSVHWLSDIIGSILLSAGLVLLYAVFCSVPGWFCCMPAAKTD